MKRGVLAVLLVALSCTWASAESAVWKAQKGGSVIYLGGTYHALREADFPLPAEFDKAYRASEVVVFETDIGKLQTPETQQKMLAKAMYADGSTIDMHLSPEAYRRLRAYCADNAIPLQAFSQLKPSLLMVTLAFLELSKHGVTQQGVDHFFYQQAHQDKKSVQGLETVDQQIEYVASMADGNEDEFVIKGIEDIKNAKEQYETLAGAWRKGDVRKLNELTIADMKVRWPELYKKLITDRNRNWLPRIEAYQKTPQTEFVLVGVAHLVGADGIIETLKRKGYKVEKL